MHIDTQGSGTDLVLVHGWAMHSGVFAPLVRELGPHFRLHLVDLPGHGFSRDDGASLDPGDCTRRIAKAVPRAIWLGWSLGGLVAMRAALDLPQQVRGLVLIAASPRGETGNCLSADRKFTRNPALSACSICRRTGPRAT